MYSSTAISIYYKCLKPVLLQVLVPRFESPRHLQSSKVPSSRIGRLFHYGGMYSSWPFTGAVLEAHCFGFSGLAASLGYGAASEFLRRSTTSTDSTESPSSLMMTEANLTRLVSKLTQMRGAALKVGQFLSIQGSCAHSLHEPLLTHTSQIHMYCHRSSTASFAACKTARTTCPTGRWRCAPRLLSACKLTFPGAPERNGFFPRTVLALLIHRFQPNTFRRRLDRAGP